MGKSWVYGEGGQNTKSQKEGKVEGKRRHRVGWRPPQCGVGEPSSSILFRRVLFSQVHKRGTQNKPHVSEMLGSLSAEEGGS